MVKYNYCKSSVLLLFLVGCSPSSFAANYYVVAGGAGNNSGADWNNADCKIPAVASGHIARGDTVYIGGSSGNLADTSTPCAGERTHYFNDAASGTTPIIIKKATATDHGTDTGWQTSYGTSAAQWLDSRDWATVGDVLQNEFWRVCQDYYIFNGQVGASNQTGTYGFYMGAHLKLWGFINWRADISPCSARNITSTSISYLEMDGVSASPPNISWIGENGLYLLASTPSSHTISGVSLSHIYLHDMQNMVQATLVNSLTFDNFYAARNLATHANHSEFLAANNVNNVTVRYSVFEDIQGTGSLVCLNGTCDTWNIYGNVFFQNALRTCLDTGLPTGFYCGWGGAGAVGDNSGGALTNLHFYNNTVAMTTNQYNNNVGIGKQNAGSGTYTVENNLWYVPSGTSPSILLVLPEGNTLIHDYNHILNLSLLSSTCQSHETCTASGSADPFRNSGGSDFTLLNDSPAAGTSLDGSSPAGCAPGVNCYNVDPTGKTRGQDGTWERGAYEFIIGPASPTNLQVVAQ
jgi:hypothetical protein